MKRFSIWWRKETEVEDSDGDWVRYEDAADLQRQLSEKQEDLDDWIHSNRIDELQRQLADAKVLIAELEGGTDPDEDSAPQLPKYARYAIENYRKKYPK